MSGSWRGGVRVLGLGVVRWAGVGRRVWCCDVAGLVGERGFGPGQRVGGGKERGLSFGERKGKRRENSN